MARKPFSALLIACVAALIAINGGRANAAEATYTREEVIYGRKYGMALTMDVFKPKSGANGAAVVLVVSGGFISSHDNIGPVVSLIAKAFLARGYTLFAVCHGSQPRYQIPEIIEDMHRSVRFIRYHAKDYGIDPNRIGVTGASAGGHLSLMLGTAGAKGDPKAKDRVDRESSRVQAVACFFPATDLLNYGGPGKTFVHAMDHAPPFRAAFDYRELDKKTMLWERITEEGRRREIAHNISPIYFITRETPPTLIYHGDRDNLVPLQQSETFVAKLKEAGIETKLVIKKGGGHGWPDIMRDGEQFVVWFDQHLNKSSAAAEVKAPKANP